jgi:beta-glucosidase
MSTSTAFDDEIVSIREDTTTVALAAARLYEQLSVKEQLSLLSGSDGLSKFLYQNATAGYGGQTYNAGVVDRLGLPGLRFSDGPRGCLLGGGTAFPISTHRAATFDVKLEEEIVSLSPTL